MPTPDTETLAARLRAVERALTDEDATTAPPTASHHESHHEDHPSETGDAPAAVDHRNEPVEGVERRLCRLEAAVQALRAALDEAEPDTTPSETPTKEEAGPQAAPRDGAGTAQRLDRPRRVPDGGGWPDDLATE